MSADNYYIIRKHPDGGFAALMGFASDGRVPVIDTDRTYKTFETVNQAVMWASDEYSEYGVSVHPECYESRPHDRREWKPGDKALVEVEVTWTNGEGDVQCSIGDDEGYFLPINALRPVGDVLHRQPGRSEAEIKADAWDEGHAAGFCEGHYAFKTECAPHENPYRQEPATGEEWPTLPLHRTEAGWPNCATCDGGGCPDCTDPA